MEPRSPRTQNLPLRIFVDGPENSHAYRSALKFAALADERGTCTSLFIYGKSGLGKTHLLLAIKNELAEKSPEIKVKYANSQAYLDDLMTEFDRQKKSNAPIMQAYHGVDVLIIDDIQNIIGKRASVDYFFQLMDEFIRNNKKVVIAADRAPKDLSMDERLSTSRFNAGMLCLVAEPSYEMKYKILQRYYENTIVAAPEAGDDSLLAAYGGDGGHLTDEHFKHMAEVSGTNIRERELFASAAPARRATASARAESSPLTISTPSPASTSTHRPKRSTSRRFSPSSKSSTA